MNSQDWLGLILTSLSILALVAGAVKWYINTQVDPLKNMVEDIQKETKTNGGSSMRDEIRSIKSHNDEADILRREMNSKLDKMYLILLDHIARNDK
jgi:hypothetical protein